jgi:hypothetical protein
MNVKAEDIKAGDTLGDGFVVDSVYQAIGNQFALFALGRANQYSTKPANRLLGFTGAALVTVR